MDTQLSSLTSTRPKHKKQTSSQGFQQGLSTYLPINQLTHQPMNQPTNLPTHPPTYPPTHPPTYLPTCLPTYLTRLIPSHSSFACKCQNQVEPGGGASCSRSIIEGKLRGHIGFIEVSTMWGGVLKLKQTLVGLWIFFFSVGGFSVCFLGSFYSPKDLQKKPPLLGRNRRNWAEKWRILAASLL